MINLKNFADRLENNAVSTNEERIIELFGFFMFSPHLYLEEIRNEFDSTTIEELKEIFKQSLIAADIDEFYDDFENYLGDEISISFPLKSIWNIDTSYYLWRKIKNRKKRIFF